MTCPACHADASEGARFCAACGMRLAGDPQPAGAPAGLPVVGERRRVSVVFADISGFTALSAALDPEEVTGLMNRCFDVLVEPVEANDGTVDKFIGDCVMALFGAPTAHEDDEIRATRAALAMRDGLARLADELQRPLSVSIGVNTGLVVAGHIGARSRRDYTVMGDAVNVAQRLQAAALPGQILVGEGIAAACGGLFVLERLAPLTVKGKAEPVVAYEARAERPRTARPRARFPLVGRAAELALIAGSLGRIAAGESATLALVGEAGSGKSRLVDQLAADGRALGHDVFVAGCEEHLRSVAYHPLRQIVGQLAGINESDRRADALGKLYGLADETAPREQLELLAPLLPGTGDEHQRPRRGALAGALAKLLRSVAVRGPVVVVLEDLHASDAATRDVLQLLPTALEGAPILLAASTRPDAPVPWPPGPGRLSHVVAPLEPAAASELLVTALGAESVEPLLAEAVRERAEGNPLFLEELARSLLEAGAVRFTGRRAGLVRSASASLPGSLLALLAARVDRLGATARDALRHAAVLGRTFTSTLLVRVAGASAGAELPTLVDAGYLLPEEGDAYRFHSPLLQEAAYGALLFADRRRLHGRVAGVLERTELPAHERVALLAHHFARSDRHDLALHYLGLAGERAVLEGDARGALGLCETGARLCAEAGSPGGAAAVPFRRIRLRALQALGELDEALLEGRALSQLAEEPPGWRAWALLHVGQMEAWRGAFPAALDVLRHGRALAEAAADQPTLAKLDNELGWILAELGIVDQAVAHLDRAIAAAQLLADNHLECSVVNHRGIAALRADDLEGGIRFLERALALAEAERARPMIWMILCNLGLAAVATGEPERSLLLFQRATRIALALFDRRGASACQHNWSAALLRLGRAAEARSLALESRATADELGWTQISALDAIVAACADALEGASQGIDEVESQLRRLEDLGLDADATDGRLLLGGVLARLGRTEAARTVLEDARAGGEKQGHGRSRLARAALASLGPRG